MRGGREGERGRGLCRVGLDWGGGADVGRYRSISVDKPSQDAPNSGGRTPGSQTPGVPATWASTSGWTEAEKCHKTAAEAPHRSHKAENNRQTLHSLHCAYQTLLRKRNVLKRRDELKLRTSIQTSRCVITMTSNSKNSTLQALRNLQPSAQFALCKTCLC